MVVEEAQWQRKQLLISWNEDRYAPPLQNSVGVEARLNMSRGSTFSSVRISSGKHSAHGLHHICRVVKGAMSSMTDLCCPAHGMLSPPMDVCTSLHESLQHSALLPSHHIILFTLGNSKVGGIRRGLIRGAHAATGCPHSFNPYCPP